MVVNRMAYAGMILVGMILVQGCLVSRAHTRTEHISIDAALGKKGVIPIAVIGSGPAGLAAALYGGAAMMETVVFEGHEPGGLLTKTTLVENWPGILPKMGPAIMEDAREQAAHAGAHFIADMIIEIDTSAWPYRLKTENGEVYHALTIIIATGSSPRMLGISGEEQFMGYGVSTCALCDRGFFRDRQVVVIGGGDSAAEEAMQLSPYAVSVKLLVRKEAMRASARMQDRLRGHENVEILYNTQPMAILGVEGADKKVTAITLKDTALNKTYDMPIDGVFLAIGHIPNSWFLKGKVELDAEGHIVMQGRSQKSSVPGIYAAGEIEDKEYRQAGVAAGHGISAALDAVRFLTDIGFNKSMAAKMDILKIGAGADNAAHPDVQKISSLAEFEAISQGSDKPILVDFYTQTCPSCMAMLPLIAQLAAEYKDRVIVLKVDADEAADLVGLYHVLRVPCLLGFKDGQLCARYNKPMSLPELQEFVQNLL